MGAQCFSVEIKRHVNIGRLASSDVERLPAQGIERRIARHGIKLQIRRTRIDELESLGLVAAGYAVVDGLHAASVVTNQQVRCIHVDAAAGDAVNAKAVARDKAETVVTCREPGNPFHVVQRVFELIGIHFFPLVAAIYRFLDGHVGLRIDDGAFVAAVAILQREDHSITHALNGQRGCHKPVACSAAAEYGSHGSHAAAIRIVVCSHAVLDHKAFTIAAKGHLVVIEVDSPHVRVGDECCDGDKRIHHAPVSRTETNQSLVLANLACGIVERDVHLGRVAGSDAEVALVDAEQRSIVRRDVDLQRTRTGIDDDELLGAVLGTYAVVHKAGVQTVYRHQQVGSLVVDVEARHAVDLCVDIRYEAETVLSLRCARYGERLEFIVESCRIVANAHPLVLAVH